MSFSSGRGSFSSSYTFASGWVSTLKFYKSCKNISILNAKSVDPSCNMPRRSLNNGERAMEEAFFGRETVIFILRNLGLVKKNKTKKNLAWNQAN